MILKTQEFQNVCKTILLAVDNSAANLEMVTKENYLFLNVTNYEYYASVKFMLNQPEAFNAVVDAKLFLNLIAGITTETFELEIINNYVQIKSGKSKYKTPMIYENDQLATLPEIKVENVSVEMTISNDILTSILNVNSKEIAKAKNLDVNELQKLYYIDETGCFTFTTGACLNSFTLAKPVKLLLNERIVNLFKLFNSDVNFALGHSVAADGKNQTRILFSSDDVCLNAIITNDDLLISRVQGPCIATKNYIKEAYSNSLVLSVNNLKAAIARLMLFTKNSISGVNMLSIPATISFNNSELTITDKQDNTEVVTIESGSFVESNYTMNINLSDFKLVLDSCKDEHITLNCGNHKSVVLARANIYNLIPEAIRG